MTNYESNSYHVEDAKGRSLAFSTVDRADEEHVLRGWSTQELADGQLTELEVFFDEDDVRGLQAFLNDRYGRNKENSRNAAPVAPIQDHELPEPGEPYAVDPEMYEPAQPDYTPGPEVYSGLSAPRQCPVIYNGVQCSKADYHVNSVQTADHTFFTQEQLQTSDGAATPPDGQPATPTPAGATAEQVPAAASATAVGAADAAPSDAKPTRTRRKKEEKAYDDALAAYQASQGNETWGPLVEAYEALKKRLPDNPRIGAAAALGLSGPQEASGFHPANEDNTTPAQEQPSVRFADEPVNPFTQPMPTQPAQAGASYMAQAQHPVNGQFTEWANNLPGEHVQDSITMTTEEAQAAKAFPCQAVHSDGVRRCTRPFGHELQTAANPEPKPHVFATENPNSLGKPEVQVQPLQQPAFTVSTPQPAGFTPGGGAQILSFQTPPTPAAPITPQGANLQPQAPAAPFLQPVPPNGGQ